MITVGDVLRDRDNNREYVVVHTERVDASAHNDHWIDQNITIAEKRGNLLGKTRILYYIWAGGFSYQFEAIGHVKIATTYTIKE